MIESLSPEQIAAIIAALVALINAIVAVLKNNEAKANAKERKTSPDSTIRTTSTLSRLTSSNSSRRTPTP